MSKNRVIVEAVLAGRSHAAVAEQYGISNVRTGNLATVSTANPRGVPVNQSLSADRCNHVKRIPHPVITFDEYQVSE
jgi:hypothetical protein